MCEIEQILVIQSIEETDSSNKQNNSLDNDTIKNPISPILYKGYADWRRYVCEILSWGRRANIQEGSES